MLMIVPTAGSRVQTVKLNPQLVEKQGSILGPLLFNIYIKILFPTKHCKMHFYADETIPYAANKFQLQQVPLCFWWPPDL